MNVSITFIAFDGQINYLSCINWCEKEYITQRKVNVSRDGSFQSESTMILISLHFILIH